jgi:uncharacterized membrane protein
MQLSTPGDVLSARGSAGSATAQELVITNTGTAPLTAVKLTADAPSGWTVTIDPEEGLPVIEARATGTIKATITPSADAVAGDYLVTFSSTAAENASGESTQIRYTVETSPLWAIVGIALIGLILAGLFYVFRTYGRR